MRHDPRDHDTFSDFEDDYESLYAGYAEPTGRRVLCEACLTQQDPDKGICRSCGALLSEPASELPF